MQMRAADATTLFRTLLIAVVVYLILIKFDPILTVLIFVIATLLDGIDGYLAVWQESKGKVTLSMYIKSFRDKRLKKTVKSYKENISKHAKFGPRMDIAGCYSNYIKKNEIYPIPLRNNVPIPKPALQPQTQKQQPNNTSSSRLQDRSSLMILCPERTTF